MTENEKLMTLKSLLGVTDTSEDEILGIYLSLSLSEIINWRYGITTSSDIISAENSEENGVAVRANVFYGALKPIEDTEYVFTYSESLKHWTYNFGSISLKNYGIYYDGTPVDGETITVGFSYSLLSQYDAFQIMACVAGYNLIGAENQTAHSENGTNRTYKYSDMVSYIHSNIAPICEIV